MAFLSKTAQYDVDVPIHGLTFPGLRWRKAWRDLSQFKLRAVLVVLSVAVGIVAFGMIIGTRNTLLTEMPRQYATIRPASATLHTTYFDQELVDSVAHMPEIAAAAGEQISTVRYQNAAGEWHDLQLFAIEDYENQDVNKIFPESGAWPPPDREVLLERASLDVTGTVLGESLLIETPDGVQRALPVAGLVHDMSQFPAGLFGSAYAYVTPDTLEWLGLPRNFNELHIVPAANPEDKQHVIQVAEDVADKMEATGAYVYWKEVPDPGHYPVKEFVPTIVILLTSLGLLALVLSAFLVVNVISAMLAQQQRQIGIMKSIGARPSTVAGLYVRLMLILGAAALALAIPLSTAGSYFLSRFVAGMINFDINRIALPADVLALEVFMGLLVPLLAALVPIRNAVRLTARESLQDYGLGQEGLGESRLDKRLVRIQEALPISRPLRISLRNTFRRKGRLARTLLTLMLGGGIFMSVVAVRASMFKTLEDTLASQGFDVQVQLERPYRSALINETVAGVPGLGTLETWQVRQGIAINADGTDGDDVLLYALPPKSVLFHADLVDGRWLTQQDGAAVVIPISLTRGATPLAVGSDLKLAIGDEEKTWQVVGVIEAFQPPMTPPLVYVSQNYFEEHVAAYGRADLFRARVDPTAGRTDVQVSQELEARLEAVGIGIRSTHTITQDRVIFKKRFNVATAILLIMAALMAVVGALGLMGTMSINVLERTREIGVMRAIGASDSMISRIFVVEGLIIGVISWAGGILVSQPISRVISQKLGMNFLQMPLHYTYNWMGPVYWLLIVLVVSTLASLLPAYQAAQLSVRQTLSYE